MQVKQPWNPNLSSVPSATLASSETSPGFVLCDPAMRALDVMTSAIAAGDISVLVTGETGTGKELFAEAIHQRSPRAGRRFLRLNCAALSETLLESELFGHEKGAFTGADRSKPGLLECAEGGTILLDEVGDMPAALQAKLLRVFEAREVLRVGGERARPIDVRVVSATNRALEADVEAGRFRKDLFYRLSGAVITLPPLRERRREIEPLARHFLARAAAQRDRPPPRIGEAAFARLYQHAWPGNVRELRNVMERALLICTGEEITPEHLPFARPARLTALGALPPPGVPPVRAVGSAEDERARIVEALHACGGNQSRAAALLGISRGTLLARMTSYGLPRPRKPTG